MKVWTIRIKISLFICSFVAICTHAFDQKPIVVIIPSYNNAAWCVKNIESVLTQNYTRYRVVYIDDCSTDTTYEMVLNKINELHAVDRVTMIRNQSRRGALANIYCAVHNCRDDEIIALVDGDDWLAHEQVLATINNAYQDPNIWMTYGQFKVHPDARIGECKEIPKGISRGNYYREYDWCTSHLRTFYAGLFKQIKLQDLIYKGNFFEVTWDMAMLFPMLEMSGGRFICIKDVLYIYNCANEANDFKTKLLLQIHCNKLISSKPKYAPLKTTLFCTEESKHVSLLVMSHDNPQNLHDFMISMERFGMGLKEIRVLYYASNSEINDKYLAIEKLFAGHLYERYASGSLKPSMLKLLCASKEYVVLAHDGISLKDTVNFDQCAQAVQKTGALGFYCGLGKNCTKHKLLEHNQELPPLISLGSHVYAWQFADGEYDWRRPFTINMALYRTNTIIALCERANYDTWQTLEQAFLLARVDLQSIGLAHEKVMIN